MARTAPGAATQILQGLVIPPYRVTMSGGGMKGLAHIGALEVLHERGFLR